MTGQNLPVLSVIAPVYNEEKNIPTLYSRLTQVLQQLALPYELILVNDGSSDRSLELIMELAFNDSRVKFINLSRNFGHQIAISAGIDHALGEAIVIIDADLQDPPELIGPLYQKMREGYEVVYARRKKREGESAIKLLTARVFYRLLHKISSVEIPIDTGDFRIMGRKIVQVLKQMPERNKFLRGQIAWAGFRQTFVEYDRSERAEGVPGYTYRKLVRLALDGITSFSDFPLKVASLSGFMVSGVAFLFMLYALYSKFALSQTPQGWTSLFIGILFLGGIQLIAIGIIGEYIGRINNNVRSRPLYVISDTNTHFPADGQPPKHSQVVFTEAKPTDQL